ncbi:MAG: FeoA family protein [Victivallales bacterium]|nr:FeoA family protein [Victivallales bacterium]
MIIPAVNNQVVALACAPAGTALSVVRADGGQHFQYKMAAMGIYPDEKIEVIDRHGGGAVIVRVKGSRLAIGRGMSEKIKVKVL